MGEKSSGYWKLLSLFFFLCGGGRMLLLLLSIFFPLPSVLPPSTYLSKTDNHPRSDAFSKGSTPKSQGAIAIIDICETSFFLRTQFALWSGVLVILMDSEGRGVAKTAAKNTRGANGESRGLV